MRIVALELKQSSSAVVTSREGQRPSLCFILSVPLLLKRPNPPGEQPR